MAHLDARGEFILDDGMPVFVRPPRARGMADLSTERKSPIIPITLNTPLVHNHSTIEGNTVLTFECARSTAWFNWRASASAC